MLGLSRITLCLLTFLSVFAFLIANILTFLSVDVDLKDDDPEATYTLQSSVDRQAIRNYEIHRRQMKMGNTSNHLMWFLQISDIHISIFQDPLRITEFQEFCDGTISHIKPHIVLATGDLTDAKVKDNMGSGQFLEEWKHYKNILDNSKVTNKTVWLDIRGNHDNFNVPSPSSHLNYYRKYSIQGQKYPRSYSHEIKIDDELYSFIGIDACLEPGPKRPFNFIGVLTFNESEHIEHLAKSSLQHGVNYTIWFGHYPTSCILAPSGFSIRNLIGQYPNSLAYLCGHFHTLGGTVPNMYTLQKAGYLELELGDWKDNRYFRLGAIDHGIFSFVDIQHNSWPVALITNPKHAMFLIPYKENLTQIETSTHIRILAYSISEIVNVRTRVDKGIWIECDHEKESPLYVAKWNPLKYKYGLHEIEVSVTDARGRKKTFEQPFSMDGTRPNFKLTSRFVLMSNVSTMFQIFYGTTILLCVLPLCLTRYMNYLFLAKKIHRPRIPNKFLQRLLRKIWILSTVDSIFYPLIFYALYLTIGPWSVGEIIEGYIGVIFAWGTIVNGSYLPGSFTYAYGFLQMMIFQIPLTLILAYNVDKNFSYYWSTKLPGAFEKFFKNIIYVGFLIVQVKQAYAFWLAYGTMAFILGPLRTWSIFLAIYLWYQSENISFRKYRDMTMQWYSTDSLQDLNN